MASLFQSNAGAMHNPLLPAGDQSTASRFGFAPAGQQRSIPREPSTRTQQPIVTGTGVLALKFKDGVMVAADTLGKNVCASPLPHANSIQCARTRLPIVTEQDSLARLFPCK